MDITREKIFEYIYFAYLSVVVAMSFLDTTVIGREWAHNIYTPVSMFLGTAVLLKCFFDFRNKWSPIKLVFAAIILSLVLFPNFSLETQYVYEYVLLMMGAKGIEEKKIIKIYLLISGLLFAITVGLMLLGAIPNLVCYRNEMGEGARMALGFIYCTDCCAHIFYMLCFWGYIRKSKITITEVVFMYLAALACKVYCDAWTSSVCILMLAVIFTAVYLDGRRKLVSEKNRGFVKTIVSYTSIIAMPLVALAFILCGIIYDSGSEFWIRTDQLLSRRLSSIHTVYCKYGFSLLGDNIYEKGMGGRAMAGLPENYFFLDSSYASILFKMGLLTLAAVLLLWFYIFLRKKKEGYVLGSLILCVIVFHGIMEHHLFQIAYSPLFLIAFAGNDKMTECHKYDGKSRRLIYVTSAFIAAVVLEAIAFNFEPLLSRIGESDSLNNHLYQIDNMEFLTDDLYCARDNVLVLYCNDFDEIISSVNVGFNLYSDSFDSQLKDGGYDVNVYSKNNEMYQLIASKRIDNGNNPDSYIETGMNYVPDELVVEVAFDEPYIFYFTNFEFNGKMPMRFSYLRMLVIWGVALIVIYLVKSEKTQESVG